MPIALFSHVIVLFKLSNNELSKIFVENVLSLNDTRRLYGFHRTCRVSLKKIKKKERTTRKA